MIFRALLLAYIVGLGFFAWGFAAGKYGIYPSSPVSGLVDEILTYLRESGKSDATQLITLDHQEKPSEFDFSGLKQLDPDFHDDGFLLISRYDKSKKQTIVELLDLGRSLVLHAWVPKLDQIFKLTPNFTTGINTTMAYRSQHPLLMHNGDIVTGSGEGPLVRLDLCGRPIWSIDRHFHHSIEEDRDGNIIAPVVTSKSEVQDGIKIRDDGIAIISPDGLIKNELSLTDLFRSNGLDYLMFGIGSFEEDRFHLNDIQPLPGKAWSDGLLVSIRNLSTIGLLNPKSEKFEWIKSGPWLNQHDVQGLKDGWISVLGNQLIRGPEKIYDDEYSEVFFYHPQSGRVKMPFHDTLSSQKFRTPYEGRATILENGDAFLEETLRFRLMRISEKKVRWMYVNNVTEKTGGALHWSRYLPRAALSAQLLKRMETLKCE